MDAHTVEVDTADGGKRTITTKYVLIATGGKPVKAPIPGSVRHAQCTLIWGFLWVKIGYLCCRAILMAGPYCCAQEHAITSDDALVLDGVPHNSILIVGAGYISVEFSSIFRGFGADVHLMYRKPLPLTGCGRWSLLFLCLASLYT